MKKDKTLAGILSFLVPGLGQVYAGKIARGIVFFVAAAIGYVAFVLPGVIVWIINIFDAVKQAERQE